MAQMMRCASTITFLTLSLWTSLRLDPLGPTALAKKRPAFPPRQSSSLPHAAFEPVEVISASDVRYPVQTTADGVLIFNVSVNARGEVKAISTLADVAGLTDAAQSSLRSWKFKPASLNGVGQTSQILVAFAFRHAVKMWRPPPFTPVFPSKEQAHYTPPGVFSATYAEYPESTIAAGATVLQVRVQADGKIGNVKVVRSVRGGFVRLAIRAARQWEFQPAVLDGTQVPSNVVIAFVFSSRALNPF